jgi:hypothetical protein
VSTAGAPLAEGLIRRPKKTAVVRKDNRRRSLRSFVVWRRYPVLRRRRPSAAKAKPSSESVAGSGVGLKLGFGVPTSMNASVPFTVPLWTSHTEDPAAVSDGVPATGDEAEGSVDVGEEAELTKDRLHPHLPRDVTLKVRQAQGRC